MRAERLAVPLLLLLHAAIAAAAPSTQPASAPAASEPASAPARRYDLRQLVAMARASYPGVTAARHAITAMERDAYRAKWAWLPLANVRGLLAPSPDIKCFDLAGNRNKDQCIRTNALAVNSFNIAGVLARIDLEVGMPIYTFNKLGSAKKAARAGVEIREAQLRSVEDKLELDVTKAYWGLKLAREILATIREGRSYLSDAEKTVEKDIDEGEGEYTMTDLLRLKTALAEVDVRTPEAEKLERFTLAALSILTGQRGKPFDVDTSVLEVLGGEPQPVEKYLQIAGTQRPDLKLLESAVRARHAAVDLERARFFPDFLFVAMVGYGYSTSVDWPQNAFYNNPFNYLSAGFGLGMSWRIEPGLQYGAYKKAQAEAKETESKKSEGELGIELEIRKAHADLLEARDRMEAARKGEKSARKWLVATSQNLAAGLSETRDLIDSLVGYFQLRLRYLQGIYDVNVGWSELGRAIGAHPKRK